MRFIHYFSILFFAQIISSECNFPSGSYISELKSPKFIEEIIIEVPKSGKFNKNFAKIISSRSINIPSDLKKNFKADLTVRYKFGSCKYKAKIRQHGDLRDHISFVDGMPSRSIKVTLESGNVFNAVRFRLLIPETRNNINEILGTVFLRELNFIVPETFQVKTKINNVESVMIFQEDIRKELLERNNKREGPIFEGDESLLWSFEDYELFELQNLALARLTNPKWFIRGSSSEVITIAAFQKIQKSYMEFTSKLPSNTFTIFPNDKKSSIFTDYFFIMLSMNGEHALNVNNRSYYHNSFSNEFEPIYYDGDFKLDQKSKLNQKIYSDSFSSDYVFPYTRLIKTDNFVEKVYKSYVSRLLDSNESNDLFFKKSIRAIQENISVIQSEIQLLNNETPRVSNIEDLYQNYSINEKNINFIQNKVTSIKKITDNSYLVESSSGIKNFFSLDEISELLSENLYKNQRSIYIPLDFIKDKNILSETSEKKFLNGSIIFSKKIAINIDAFTKTININQSTSSDWILFRNNNLNDWNINFIGMNQETNVINNNQRFNKAGMTGCLNFYDVAFKNAVINVSKGECEDSLNIVNSSGVIREITIHRSFADAVDLDFSELTIQSLKINAAGNDCLDVSGGYYIIDRADLDICNDKGISVGEKSNLIANDLEIKNSVVGVAAKDSSIVEINNGNFVNTKICLDAYQKKQEFGGAIAKYKKIICDGDFKKDINSSIIRL